MIPEFSCVYNCHYQFGVSLTAIFIDSQMVCVVLGGLYAQPPHYLREHNLVLCLFWLAVTFAWLL